MFKFSKFPFSSCKYVHFCGENFTVFMHFAAVFMPGAGRAQSRLQVLSGNSRSAWGVGHTGAVFSHYRGSRPSGFGSRPGRPNVMLWGSPGGGLASQAASPVPAPPPPLLCTAVRPRPLSQDVVCVVVQGQSEPRGQAESESSSPFPPSGVPSPSSGLQGPSSTLLERKMAGFP